MSITRAVFSATTDTITLIPNTPCAAMVFQVSLHACTARAVRTGNGKALFSFLFPPLYHRCRENKNASFSPCGKTEALNPSNATKLPYNGINQQVQKVGFLAPSQPLITAPLLVFLYNIKYKPCKMHLSKYRILLYLIRR